MIYSVDSVIHSLNNWGLETILDQTKEILARWLHLNSVEVICIRKKLLLILAHINLIGCQFRNRQY